MRDKATVMVHINAGGKGVRERRITFGDYWDSPPPRLRLIWWRLASIPQMQPSSTNKAVLILCYVPKSKGSCGSAWRQSNGQVGVPRLL